MARLKIEPKTVVSLILASLLFVSGAAWQNIRAQAAGAAPAGRAMAGPDRTAPLPAYLPPPQAPDQPDTLSSTLSYYFISGNTFTADLGSSVYARQTSGCVNQMPIGNAFSAPVHLPQASVVVSVTLYTYDTAITTTVSTAYFIFNNGQGTGGYTLSADSAPNTAGYQHHQSTVSNPTTIDNQDASYMVQWVKPNSNTDDSPYLSLCGVRVAYYAPVAATFLPVTVK
jgi:hypothetical protein